MSELSFPDRHTWDECSQQGEGWNQARACHSMVCVWASHVECVPCELHVAGREEQREMIYRDDIETPEGPCVL